MTFFPLGNVCDVFWMGCLDKCLTGLADFLQCESNKLTNHFKGGFFQQQQQKQKINAVRLHTVSCVSWSAVKQMHTHTQSLLVLAWHD